MSTHFFPVAPDKRKDQHFLTDLNVLRKIVEAAAIEPDEDVLEIGAGPGNLTEALSKKARHVYSIEMDKAYAGYLKDKLKDKNVTVIEGDALRVDFPRFDKAVANLPYSISSEITFKLLRYQFKSAVLMYQKEFAERMAAKTGDEEYSRLSVTVQHFADVELLFNVSSKCFVPQPEVESAVVRLTPRPAPYHVRDERLFMSLVTAAFGGRRKRLKNALLKGAGIMGLKDARSIIARLPPELVEKRAEELDPEDFARLADIVSELKDGEAGDQDIQG